MSDDKKRIRWSHFYFLLQTGKNPHTSKDPHVNEWLQLGLDRLFSGPKPLITLALRDRTTSNPRSKENVISIEFAKGDIEMGDKMHRSHAHCSLLIKHTGNLYIDNTEKGGDKYLMSLFQEATKCSKWPEGKRLAFFSVNGRADNVREGEEYQVKETGKVKKQVITYNS